MGMGCSKVAITGMLSVLALTGCRTENTDTSKVIAKIGDETTYEKVTEKQFQDLVSALFGDAEKGIEFMTQEQSRGQRNEFFAKYIEAKGLVMLAKAEGLDDDPKIRLQLDDAITAVYYQALMERRLSNTEPTDAQLREIYNEIAARERAMGAGIPPFEEVRPHLPQLWRQKQQQEVTETLMKEIKEKYPTTIVDEYKTANG
jgi:hypothetical protein